ncbi:hypothetical protein BG015_010639 [Linnemannia schmuckeri]|uniref:Crinkler effector protein N-terminal domain-containing protein n=1 Tax=Linnemannia schmuckeri TaxID=64567 RepID=A0A9P5RTR1_9FUNG|nr:hypothetical protein BG015_010639 [Linnemannia schmuckeri]
MSTSMTLFVVISGETISESFPIDISNYKTVGHLKQLIKEANPTSLSDIDARRLKIWHVDISFTGSDVLKHRWWQQRTNTSTKHLHQRETSTSAPSSAIRSAATAIMSNSLITLFVIIDHESIADAFPIDVDPSMTVGHLKQLIKRENPRSVNGFDARKLRLWHINIPYAHDRGYEDTIRLREVYGRCLLAPYLTLEDLFGTKPDGRNIHVLVELPERQRGIMFSISLTAAVVPDPVGLAIAVSMEHESTGPVAELGNVEFAQ